MHGVDEKAVAGIPYREPAVDPDADLDDEALYDRMWNAIKDFPPQGANHADYAARYAAAKKEYDAAQAYMDRWHKREARLAPERRRQEAKAELTKWVGVAKEWRRAPTPTTTSGDSSAPTTRWRRCTGGIRPWNRSRGAGSATRRQGDVVRVATRAGSTRRGDGTELENGAAR